ncbi:MAG: diacylglycerol kinase family protein [Myxococcota bacterium]|nr:diacylglycerol kinase family protein [Myxococcota bacterium]
MPARLAPASVCRGDPIDHLDETDSTYLVPQGRVGILLNANAGRVRKPLVRRLRKAAPRALLFFTHSLEEAQDAIEAAIESGVTTLFAGGGDGTIIDLANRMLRYENAPRLGILRLGTGNALATWVGARSPVDDLRAWSVGEAYREIDMRFVQAEDESFPFAGIGWDAAVLNDYRWAKQYLKGTPFEAKPYHLPTYLAAAFARTVPRYTVVKRRAPMVTVEVTGGTAWRIDKTGHRIGSEIEAGEVLYRGPAHMVAFGTTPYYGYAMKMLPQACADPDRFQLRISSLSISTAINQLPNIWTGEFEDERLSDFLAQKLHVTFDQEVPYQVGGDARGMRESLELSLSPLSLPVLSFR